MPSNSGRFADDRQPVASTRYEAVYSCGNIVVGLDLSTQVVAIGDVIGVAEDLRLAGVALGPVPFLLQLVVEGVGVLHALDVAAGAGIAVPVPGAATP
jgi:hypothetical protein